MGAFYCSICRKTDFSGKGHIYGKSHQSKLKIVIVKFMEKVKEARRTIKNPQVEKYSPDHDVKFWCYCCGLEVQKHVTDSNITVLHGGLLEHMSTLDHRKNTLKFWWENKADPKLRDKFIVTEEETDRFKSEVVKALEQFEENSDVFIKEQAAVIRSQEQHRLEVLQALSEPDPELLQPAELGQHNNEHTASSHSGTYEMGVLPESSHDNLPSHSQWNDSGLGLTFVGYQDSSSSVHTGAVPPWLLEEPDEGLGSGQQEMGPSLQEFLKHKEHEKLRKLPPNRVGANFDHSSHTDANWLPSFGRVWNSGRRWQSRHHFREEEVKTRGKRKWADAKKETKKQKGLSNGDLFA
ncbi:centrosomal AT-AC splicing factor-like isoform X2 [Myxocyprinus asiaticus]|uniref:centrosomal AT-AC splicing factor-like isoform X2 n=1 Tax=Myxocyprinus asiaticus TaxID=70543 RepID=UPI002223B09B|nr:centrosomal AT-AC splicing factor-like isoform X2 [Myxocyprinus asiaticus]